MFGLAAWNRLLKKPQDEKVVLSAHYVLGQKQINAGLKALRLLKLHKHTEALTRENIMDFLYTVGMNPTPDVLHGKLRLLRLHKEETFTWGELAHVWSLLLRDAANEDRILERAFAFFDKDGNGEIDVAELRTTMSELGDLLTEEEIMSFVSIMDVDNDGVIGYQEFLTTLRSEVPKFVRARASSQEDHPEMQQQHQQQHYLAPPPAARAAFAAGGCIRASSSGRAR
ncbi:hypothetical protein OEZ86_014228 [Tetradesmus obliquus]|nr:hypothetical protein OEZ86_014228 [Tetradesmus obliquus]